ncbi:hypothetical protein B0T21DRAFT_131524 [Apiosordaria backusii]|uniref:Nephrocystin 3-like N-terminal domain-containing protein n=1 Tax=Apiosordaria backusii TaxID=314023 RepID=A0AA40K1I3_9PEZI|nr:hypothetical protein B0T21DRAFT_131524 [Apiosordaria backusii]
MSGLEPLAALSFVCNVFQVISFTGEFYAGCRKIFDGERPGSNLSDRVKRLIDVCDVIEAAASSAPRPLTQNDRQLEDIVEDCRRSAQEVKQLVDEFSTVAALTGRWKMFKSVKLWTKFRFKFQRELDEREKKLEMHQRALETQLQLDNLLKTKAIGVREQDDFDALDSRLRGFIDAYANGQTHMDELDRSMRQHITAVTTKLTAITVDGFKNQEKQIAEETARLNATFAHEAEIQRQRHADSVDEAKYQKFLNSLKYNSMNQRRNQIAPASAKTFSWIFGDSECYSDNSGDIGLDDSDLDGLDNLGDFDDEDGDDDEGKRGIRVHKNAADDHHNYDKDDRDDADGKNFEYEDITAEPFFRSCLSSVALRNEASGRFKRWLRSPNEPIFWISGKAGSGKSTLMKFLATHRQTKNHLSASRRHVLILSHFIWAAGQQMERRIKGVLCSLLYQLLDACKDIAEKVLAQSQTVTKKESDSDWNEQELKKVLFFVLRQCDKLNRAVCVFLDGLDEIDFSHSEGQDRLLKLLDELQCIPSLKLCVASRAEPAIVKRLSCSPALKIHELTALDIWGLVAEQVEEKLMDLPSPDGYSLILRMCEMADGVFLWVVLAVQSLQRGLECGDAIWDLWERLSVLPKDIMGLYQSMWDRLRDDKPLYQNEAANYFNLVLSYPKLDDDYPLQLGEVYLASNVELTDRFRRGSLSLAEMRKLVNKECETLTDRIPFCTGGLLEVVPQGGPTLFACNHSIRLIHRSAKDFLEETEEGRKLRGSNGPSESQRITNLATAILMLYLCGFPNSYRFRRCIAPYSYLAFIGEVYDAKKITKNEMFDIASLVKHIYELYPLHVNLVFGESKLNLDHKCYRFWKMAPCFDFLSTASWCGLFDVVKREMERLQHDGQVSVGYKTYLLAAVLGGSWLVDVDEEDSEDDDDYYEVMDPHDSAANPPSPKNRETLTNLLLDGKIDPESRFCMFSWDPIYDCPIAVPITLLECAMVGVVYGQQRRRAKEVAETIAPVLDRILEIGVEMSGSARFCIFKDLDVRAGWAHGFNFQLRGAILYIETNVGMALHLIEGSCEDRRIGIDT